MGSSMLGGDGKTIFYSPRSPGFSDDLTSRVTAARIRAFRLDPDSVTEVSVPSSLAPATSLGRHRRGRERETSKNCGAAVDAPYAGDIFVMRCDGADVCRLSEDGSRETTLHTLGRQLRSCCTILKRSSSDGG